ncbi:MAG: DUF2513 domain-containing protein [Proteobacteria bacterium]|nr:DUF2513 domain-containing protein [Pseudomonadota bacterium]
MNLVREMLLELEKMPIDVGAIYFIDADEMHQALPAYDLATIAYHMELIQEAGFINAGGSSGSMTGFAYRGLSWNGHEFLDDVRDPDIWRKTRARIDGLASVGIQFVWEIAKAEMKKQLGLP